MSGIMSHRFGYSRSKTPSAQEQLDQQQQQHRHRQEQELHERIPLLQEKQTRQGFCSRILKRKPLIILIIIAILLLLIVIFTLIAQRSLVLTLIGGIGSLSSCTSCTSLLVPLRTLAQLGDGPFVSAFTALCVRFNIQDAEVCAGAVGSQAPLIAHSLRSLDTVAGPGGEALCSKIFGLCNEPVRPPWKVPLDKPQRHPNKHKKLSTGKPPVQVVQISDIHLDRHYEVGSEANCSRAICCRKHNGIPIFDDPNPKIKDPAGKFGNPQCDTPVPLLETTVETINKLAPDALFTIYTGDSIDHAVWKAERDEVEAGIELVYNILDGLDKPLYSAIGNHDTSPTNSFPRRETNDRAHDWDWVYSAHAQAWNVSEKQVVSSSGCYAFRHPSGIRVLSINNNIAATPNYWIYDSDKFYPDPNGVLQWLAKELQDAEDANERAYVIGHVPPGAPLITHYWNYAFNNLIKRYQDIVPAQFFGHTHKAQFEVTYNALKRYDISDAFSISYVAPSLTPISGHPTLRIYHVDPDTFEVMDFDEYIANIDDDAYQKKPEFKLWYSARKEYGSLLGNSGYIDQNNDKGEYLPLNSTFWHLVSEVMRNDDDAFQQYVRRSYRYTKHPNRKLVKSKSRKHAWLNQLRNPAPRPKPKPGLHVEQIDIDEDPNTPPDEIFLAAHHSHIDTSTIFKQIALAIKDEQEAHSTNHVNNASNVSTMALTTMSSIKFGFLESWFSFLFKLF